MSATNVAQPNRPPRIGFAARASAPENRLGTSAVASGGLAMFLVMIPPVRGLGGGLAVLALVTGICALGRSRRHDGEGRDAAWVGIVLAVLATVGLFASQAAFGNVADTRVSGGGEIVAGGSPSVADPSATTRQVLTQQLGVAIGEVRRELDQSGIRRATLPVTVTNTSDRTRTFQLEFQARGADGQPLTTDSARITSLGAGQTATIQVFSILSDTLSAELAKATFSVTSATSS